MQAYEEMSTPPDMVPWEGVLWMEDTVSKDDRVVEEGSLEWELPLPLLDVDRTPAVVGTITRVMKGETGRMIGQGFVQPGSLPEGEEREVGIDILIFSQADEENHFAVTDGRLIGATFSPSGSAWPECKIRRA